ncbi:MAG: hypothetical protein OHK93_005788 [Ramalina farinacea]|uniref:Cytochrome P450 n=1 Tax=Ramalina farinacea TaxID=258253 RepID=A0AA43TW82_9LECA|nr:hypothetical protein [Ramalina farinacea]
MSAQLPVLPPGSSSILSGLSETFSFHSSPESFITSRVLAFRRSHPSLADSRTPIRAKVLNRNVAVISSYDHVRTLLCDEDVIMNLSSSKAYDELMAPFFPPPNLLLLDPPEHGPRKAQWLESMAELPDRISKGVRSRTLSHFENIRSGSSIDLYDSMKFLSWDLILGIFLGNLEDPQRAKDLVNQVEKLQEDLLRGQFSLFPVSVNTRFWQSPRSKGLAARKKLQEVLKSHVGVQSTGCPFVTSSLSDKEDVANHLLLFTSSLAAKALASLLTALMMNLFVSCARNDGRSELLSDMVLSTRGRGDQNKLIESIVLETERLSPPVVGIMRQTTADVILSGGSEQSPDIRIPGGWDAWLYFVGASRDPAVFGDTAASFVPHRYLQESGERTEGFAFGAGPKTCLGRDLMRQIAMTVAKTCLGLADEETNVEHSTPIKLNCPGDSIPEGVRGWLGWQADVKPEVWARDMKQLPTQRPTKPLMVTLTHDLSP